MNLTGDIELINRFLFDQLDGNKASFTDGIQTVQAVYYGDQEKLPVTPCICVESGEKNLGIPRRYIGSGGTRQMDVQMNVYILVYHSNIKDVQYNRQQNDKLVGTVEAFLHSNMHLKDRPIGGDPVEGSDTDRVLDSYCIVTEPGYRGFNERTIVRGSRITFQIRSQVTLPC